METKTPYKLLPRAAYKHGHYVTITISDSQTAEPCNLRVAVTYYLNAHPPALREAAEEIAAYIRQIADALDDQPDEVAITPEPAILPRGEEDTCPTP